MYIEIRFFCGIWKLFWIIVGLEISIYGEIGEGLEGNKECVMKN